MLLVHFVGVALALTAAVTDGVNVCVTRKEDEACRAMMLDPAVQTLNINCVTGNDRYDCLAKVMYKEADVTWVTGEDVFLARELYANELQILAEIRTSEESTEPWRYKGVAVVRKTSIKGLESLKGSKSCHTGYRRTAGWNIPFSHLLEKNLVQLQCDQQATVVEHDLKAVSSFFGSACIPGSWAPDHETNTLLKTKYSNLCNMCTNPTLCDSQDEHAGYEGALRCLVDANGDVAWTKLSVAKSYFKERTDVSTGDFGLLCPDGRVQSIDSPKDCHWAARPWNAWIVRTSHKNKKMVLSELKGLMTAAFPPVEQSETALKPWVVSLLGTSSHSVIHDPPQPVSLQDYLKEPGYDTTIERLGCPEVPVKLCVESQLGLEKCTALQHVLKSRRILPKLECLMPSPDSDCLATVASGNAHITTADGGDVFRGHVEYGLTPVVSERYGLLDASYFAVAVVRANSGITSLSQLKGKKSCHTGIGKTAGWKIPVVTLQKAGLLENGDCDFAGQIGRFFNGSCAPGSKDPTYDPNGTNPTSLCDLCVGNDVAGGSSTPYTGASSNGRCERNSDETFYGYTGAFRCLVQGGGDVAFVKHITVRDNTNGNNKAPWAKDLRALDFKLLCNKRGIADVVDYESCNLARVPAHKVLTGVNVNDTMMEEIRILMLRASNQLLRGQDIFTMFGPFKGRQDIIFKDSATELVNVPQDEFHQFLKDNYFSTLSELEACRPKELSLQMTATGGAQTPSFIAGLHLLVCLVVTRFITWSL